MTLRRAPFPQLMLLRTVPHDRRSFRTRSLVTTRSTTNACHARDPIGVPPRMTRRYRLLGADGRTYDSAVPGALGGHTRLRLYGRLDCPSARRWLARGHYARHRVFFADEATARAAGHRPCAVCLPREYEQWTTLQEDR
jgi:hypothetical protein